MSNGPVITQANGWKVVSWLIIGLFTIIGGLGALVWNNTTNDIEVLSNQAERHAELERREMRDLQGSIAILQAHYEHIEDNQLYIREKVDEIMRLQRDSN